MILKMNTCYIAQGPKSANMTGHHTNLIEEDDDKTPFIHPIWSDMFPVNPHVPTNLHNSRNTAHSV